MTLAQRDLTSTDEYKAFMCGVTEGMIEDERSPNTTARDVYESPTAASLDATFREIFTVRRNLRFLN